MKEINLIPNDTENLKKFIEDFSLLKSCGLDDGDIEVFSNGPILGTILVELTSNKESNSKLTFQILYDKILKFKELEQYELIKTTILVSNELSKRPADIDNWEKDKVLLQKLQVPSDFIDKFYTYLKEHSNPEKTYKQVFTDFQKTKSIEPKPSEKEHGGIFKNAGNVNYNDLLNKSIELEKPLLLYFTGYACVNARKIEQYVLSNNSIMEKLKNEFYFVNLYVDNKKSLPEDEQTKSKRNGKLIKYVGQKHSELQIDKFKNNFQPYFVIIDKNGDKIKEQGYTTDIVLFEKFLTLDK
ncbi:thioredoxin family protein [Flavivirga jejuensis]|nr:thioredoxin family protein [Flavivirga jejuensis]